MKIILEAQHACTPTPRGIPCYTIQLIRNLLRRKAYDYELTFFDCNRERNNKRYIDKYFGEFNVISHECNELDYRALSHNDDVFAVKSYNDYTQTDGDVYHFTASAPVPVKLHGKPVITIHDLLPIIYPEFFNDMAIEFFMLSWKRLQELNPIIIADSYSTKLDIQNLSSLKDVHVIHLGYNETSFYYEENPELLAEMGIYPPYILYCGAIDMRKNINRILDAFNSIARKFPKVTLVLAGGTDDNASPIYNRIESHKFKSRIITMGFITDEQKRVLMSGAECFLFPSLYEGFGLPILEAMACGCPVITSNTSSMPEVAGDAAILIDPNNIEQISYEVERVATSASLREKMRYNGMEQCRKFSWDKTAEMTEKVYKTAAEMVSVYSESKR